MGTDEDLSRTDDDSPRATVDRPRTDGGLSRRPRVPASADRGAIANVDETGTLGEIKFTAPAEGVSQDVYADDPTTCVGVPEGVELETPSYSIRSEMNDIETPDE